MPLYSLRTGFTQPLVSIAGRPVTVQPGEYLVVDITVENPNDFWVEYSFPKVMLEEYYRYDWVSMKEIYGEPESVKSVGWFRVGARGSETRTVRLKVPDEAGPDLPAEHTKVTIDCRGRDGGHGLHDEWPGIFSETGLFRVGGTLGKPSVSVEVGS